MSRSSARRGWWSLRTRHGDHDHQHQYSGLAWPARAMDRTKSYSRESLDSVCWVSPSAGRKGRCGTASRRWFVCSSAARSWQALAAAAPRNSAPRPGTLRRQEPTRSPSRQRKSGARSLLTIPECLMAFQPGLFALHDERNDSVGRAGDRAGRFQVRPPLSLNPCQGLPQ